MRLLWGLSQWTLKKKVGWKRTISVGVAFWIFQITHHISIFFKKILNWKIQKPRTWWVTIVRVVIGNIQKMLGWILKCGRSSILKIPHWPQCSIYFFFKINLNFKIPIGSFCEDCHRKHSEKVCCKRTSCRSRFWHFFPLIARVPYAVKIWVALYLTLNVTQGQI